MRIGYFCHSEIGISETFIWNTLTGLAGDSGNEVHLFNPSLYRNNDLQITHHRFVPEARSGPMIMLRRLAKRFSLFYPFFEWANGLRIKRQLPRKLSACIDVAMIDYATNAIGLMKYLKRHDIPFVVHVHGFDITSTFRDPHFTKAFATLVSYAGAFIVASDHMRRLLILRGCPEEKIHLIRYGVDQALLKPMSWTDRRNNPPSVVFLGRLTPKKNPIALIHAFKHVNRSNKDVKFTIIGDGPLMQEVVALVQDLELNDRIELLGSMPNKEAMDRVNQHWIYAQHSVSSVYGDQEGFAISLAEAASLEIPVVSTFHNGIPENVVNGETGLLVPEFNYEAMADAILRLIRDPKMAQQMGKAGRLHIAELCDPQNRITRLGGLLRSFSAETSGR